MNSKDRRNLRDSSPPCGHVMWPCGLCEGVILHIGILGLWLWPKLAKLSHRIWDLDLTEQSKHVKTASPVPSSSHLISGWWYTYPSEEYESQLGWWHSQYMENKSCSSHQPDLLWKLIRSKNVLSYSSQAEAVGPPGTPCRSPGRWPLWCPASLGISEMAEMRNELSRYNKIQQECQSTDGTYEQGNRNTWCISET